MGGLTRTFSPQPRRKALPNPVQVRGHSRAGETGKEVGLGDPSGVSPGAAAGGEVVKRGAEVWRMVWRRVGGPESARASPPAPAGRPQQVSSAGLKSPRSMVAAFDYNPRESSPNMDVEVRTPTESPAKGVAAGPRQG